MSIKKNKLEKKEYEKLGRLLVSVGEIGVADKKKLYKLAFYKAVVSGLGGVIGATIVVALLLFGTFTFGRSSICGACCRNSTKNTPRQVKNNTKVYFTTDRIDTFRYNIVRYGRA